MSASNAPRQPLPSVLVVDSSKVTLVAARKLLEPHLGVYLAEDGEMAWSLLESVPEITAVFTDQSLSGMDGTALLQRIRDAEDERIADLPVIIITSGERNEATRRAAFEAGATDFILKPFDPVDLLTRARAWSTTSQRAAGLREHNNVLRSLVMLDADTRAGNRDYFLQETVKDRSFCMRHQAPHSLLCISIDGYDRILREHGRQGARDAVAMVADVVRGKCRREDTFARVGESQFALSLPYTPPLGARVLAERIRQAVANRPFRPRGITAMLTISLGVTLPAPDEELSTEQILDAGLRAVKKAASSGGNQTCVVADAMVVTAPAPVAAPPASAAVAGDDVPLLTTTLLSGMDVAQVLQNPLGFIEELLPVLRQLSDSDRLTLVEQLLVMAETPDE